MEEKRVIKTMVYFCTNCWNEIDKGETICSNCGANQAELEGQNFSEKLIRALNHPEPETPIRAAAILSRLKAKEAILVLLSKLKNENDPFIIKAVVDALLELDPKLINEIKKIIGTNPPVTIKKILE